MGSSVSPVFEVVPPKQSTQFEVVPPQDSQAAIKQKYKLPASVDLTKSFMNQDTQGVDPISFSKAYAEVHPPPPEAKGFLANMWGEAKNIVSHLGPGGSEGAVGTASNPGIPFAGAVGTIASRIDQAKTDLPGALGKTATDALAVAAPVAIGKGIDAIPDAARAGASLSDVKAAAGNVPIDMTKPGNTALELYEQSQRGATLPKVVRDFVKRATAPGSDPITYEEAKDFQSNVSSLSADEKMALKPNTKRLLGQLNSDLKASLEDAADTVGKGEQFADAMKEYHNAMTIRGMTDSAKELAVKASLTGLGLSWLKRIMGGGSQ